MRIDQSTNARNFWNPTLKIGVSSGIVLFLRCCFNLMLYVETQETTKNDMSKVINIKPDISKWKIILSSEICNRWSFKDCHRRDNPCPYEKKDDLKWHWFLIKKDSWEYVLDSNGNPLLFTHLYIEHLLMRGMLFCLGFLVLSFTSISQTVYHAYETGIASLDSIKNWSYKTTKPVNLTITFQDKSVRLNDPNKTTYLLHKMEIMEPDQEIRDQKVWLAMDNAGTKCALSILWFRSDTIRIQIDYYTKHNNHESTFYNVTEMNKQQR